MTHATSALVDAIIDSVIELGDEASKAAKPVLLKALPDQDRFKLSSIWILKEDGSYQHLQSGRHTTAERLAGYTRVIKRG